MSRVAVSPRFPLVSAPLRPLLEVDREDQQGLAKWIIRFPPVIARHSGRLEVHSATPSPRGTKASARPFSSTPIFRRRGTKIHTITHQSFHTQFNSSRRPLRELHLTRPTFAYGSSRAGRPRFNAVVRGGATGGENSRQGGVGVGQKGDEGRGAAPCARSGCGSTSCWTTDLSKEELVDDDDDV